MSCRFQFGTALLVAIFGLMMPAQAQVGSRKFGELLKRLPDHANVLLLVDVEGLYQSKQGQRERWREDVVSRSAAGLGLADHASKIVVATSYDMNTLEENWKLGMAEARGALPDIERLAAHEGGFVEKIRNMSVAWTPRGFYLVTFPPRIFGFVEKADRHAMWKWIDTSLSKPRAFPPSYADRAFYRADAGSQIVLAMNLAEAVAPKLVVPWLKTIPNVAKSRVDPESLADRLATVQSGFLEINASETLTATLHVDFKPQGPYGPPVLRDATPVLKELIINLLGDYGAVLPELPTWTLRFDEKQQSIELTGRIGIESVRRILSLAHPPALTPAPQRSAGQAESKERVPTTTFDPSRDDIIMASQQYYRSVVDLLKGLKEQRRPTYRSMKLWYDRYAKQIEELPILGIDEELLDWGSQVARLLREMSSGINYSAKDQNYRLAQSPNGAYAGYGYYAGGSKTYDQSVIKRQSDAVLSVQLDARWQAIETGNAEMRRKMVDKYHVDF